MCKRVNKGHRVLVESVVPRGLACNDDYTLPLMLILDMSTRIMTNTSKLWDGMMHALRSSRQLFKN